MVQTPTTGKIADILLLYGSETGNCEQISEDLCETLNETSGLLEKTVQRFKMNEYKRAKMTDKSTGIKIVVFICSSTGDGEGPENAQEFFRFLRRESAKIADDSQGTILSHVFYTVLGLGSSDYSKYQGAPRFLDTRLKMLGASSFHPRAEADEATSLETVIEPWLESIGSLLAS